MFKTRRSPRRIIPSRPKSRDGQLARQIASEVGDEYVDYLRKSTEHFYSPISEMVRNAVVYKGELMARVMGGTGFASYSDLIAEATAGKRQMIPFVKVGTTAVIGRGLSFWAVGSQPAAGAAEPAWPATRSRARPPARSASRTPVARTRRTSRRRT